MKKNWMYGSMVAALFAVLASSCGNSQQVLDFRGICVDDTHGENGIYNPGRGFRLETAVDVKEEKTVRQKNCWNCLPNTWRIVFRLPRAISILLI